MVFQLASNALQNMQRINEAKVKQTEPSQLPRIRVMLVDDHHVVRAGIHSGLDLFDDIDVIGEASNGHDALTLVQHLHPDVLLLDIHMPGLNGLAVAEHLYRQSDPAVDDQEAFSPPHVLILSAYCDPTYVYDLFAVGVKGYLLKDETPERIATGIRQVMQGEPALSLPVQKVLLTRKPEPKYDLTVREIEILRLMAEGNNNQIIAQTLVIAITTVKNHISNIYKKLPNVSARSEAVAWAWKNRIVEIE